MFELLTHVHCNGSYKTKQNGKPFLSGIVRESIFIFNQMLPLFFFQNGLDRSDQERQ